MNFTCTIEKIPSAALSLDRIISNRIISGATIWHEFNIKHADNKINPIEFEFARRWASFLNFNTSNVLLVMSQVGFFKFGKSYTECM